MTSISNANTNTGMKNVKYMLLEGRDIILPLKFSLSMF